jgi:hypothetical protein
MRRVGPTVSALMLLLLALLGARPAFAHGLGRSYDLPLPVWLYLYGAAAAVLVSFVPISLLADKRQAPGGYPRFDLLKIGPLRALLSARPFLTGLRLLSVTLFVLVILSGLLGKQTPSANFAPTFVWITWWVGLTFFTAFVGNIWPLINPWKITFEWAEGLARRLGVKGGIQLGLSYPTRLGVWPALVFYAAAIWIEVDFAGSSVPVYVAFFVVAYSWLTWWGMLIFGKDTWLRYGEMFSVFYALLGRFAPTEVRVTPAKLCEGCSGTCSSSVEDGCVNCYECFAKAAPQERELNLRPPAVGLTRSELVPPGGLVFVVFVLASVSYDGLVVTTAWTRVEYLLGVPRTLGLLMVPLLFLTAYLSFVKLSQLLGGGHTARFGELAAAYVYSLVPIAIAYEVAHYYTFFLVQGQRIASLISDPFGWDWNLFGTAGYGLNTPIPEANFVWYSQVALIVGGHVVAVYLAHLVALRLLNDRRKALFSQLPMLVLMVLYTVSSLWILSQPIIEEDKVAAAPPEPITQPTQELRQPSMPSLPDSPSMPP